MDLNDQDKLLQSALGGQDYLRYASVPATAAQIITSVNGEPGQQLIDTPKITVAGTYTAIIPLSGMVTNLEVHVKATIVSGAVSTTLATLYKDKTTSKTVGGGTGALTSTVRQSSTISALSGEQFALLTLTVTGATPDITFTQAEFNGL